MTSHCDYSRPAVVVCLLDSDHEGNVEDTEAFQTILDSVGIDVVIAPICDTCGKVFTNWAGDRVLLVGLQYSALMAFFFVPFLFVFRLLSFCINVRTHRCTAVSCYSVRTPAMPS